MCLKKRLDDALNDLKNNITFPDGLNCHCDPECNAAPCEICSEIAFLNDVKIEIMRLENEIKQLKEK